MSLFIVMWCDFSSFNWFCFLSSPHHHHRHHRHHRIRKVIDLKFYFFYCWSKCFFDCWFEFNVHVYCDWYFLFLSSRMDTFISFTNRITILYWLTMENLWLWNTDRWIVRTPDFCLQKYGSPIYKKPCLMDWSIT